MKSQWERMLNSFTSFKIGEQVVLKTDLKKCGKIVGHFAYPNEDTYEIIWEGENKVSHCYHDDVLREKLVND